MAGVKKFQEILAWQMSHRLTLSVYLVTRKLPRYEEFGLANQMRRSSSSIPSNIVEGFKRQGVRDSVHFYNIAEGSLEELKYQLLLSRDLEYVSDKVYLDLLSLAEEAGRLLFSWKKSSCIPKVLTT